MMDLDEDLFPLLEAPKHFPGPAPRPHVSTLVRWALKGVGKGRVRLETVMIGGRRYTSRPALVRFVARLSGNRAEAEAAAKERGAAVRKAEAEADAEGIA